MDSGNSGSLQSSSGGDDQEYDSTFLNSAAAAAASFRHLPPPPPQLHHQALFDTFSFLDSNLNLEIPWTSTPRPNPSYTDIVQTLIPSPLPRPAVPATHPPPPPASDHPPAPAVRPSKKRSRASRRAPTTVLTTDTSNFRAMVQEFTGIPSPPFASSSSSPFSRSRFDLFRSPPSPYLLRPFASKLQQTAMTSNPVPAPTTNYQLPDLGRHDLLNFHPFLQSNISPKPLVPAIPTDQGSYEGGVNGVMGLPGSGWSAREEVSQAQFRPVHAAGGSQGAATCTMNLAAARAATEFGGNDKVSDHNAPARGSEGMMESWTCSSD